MQEFRPQFGPDRDGEPRSKTLIARPAIKTSRLSDFFTESGLRAQIGHDIADWPCVVLKELADNAIDAAEDQRIPPTIAVTADEDGITVVDNGPGIPAETITSAIDYRFRTSSRAHLVMPSRGRQGNALQTIFAIPYVLDGNRGDVVVESQGLRHAISVTYDKIRREPTIGHTAESVDCKNGTTFTVRWPKSSCSTLANVKDDFLQLAEKFTFLNPHLTLTVDWYGERCVEVTATSADWPKYRPADPSSPHWYSPRQFHSLLCAYRADDDDRGRDRTIREIVAEFDGLSGSLKPPRVLDAAGIERRTKLSALVRDGNIDPDSAGRLLTAMKAEIREFRPERLGIIGREHLEQRFNAAGIDAKTFDYAKKVTTDDDGVPCVIESAFGAFKCALDTDAPRQRRWLIGGVNWSPGIIPQFPNMGEYGDGIGSLLAEQEAGAGEPVLVLLHVAYPRVTFADWGKREMVLERTNDIEREAA